MNIKLSIPESFFQGEERCGYYVSPKMKRVWAVMLDLLAEFQRVCGKHNLKWWMDGGTLLGAVRHKGFIPWDHDVDVMMMRSDYERLCNIAPEEFNYPYRLVTPENSVIPKMFSRLINESTTMLTIYAQDEIKRGLLYKHEVGIMIDIFPVDKIPDEQNDIQVLAQKVKKTFRLAQKIHSLTDYYRPSPSLWKRPFKAFLHHVLMHSFIKYKFFVIKSINIAKSCNKSNVGLAAKMCMADRPNFMERRIWKLSDFDGTTYFPFEMLTLPAPSGWENILNVFYGDWHEFVIRTTNGQADPDAMFYDTEHPDTYYTLEGHPFDEDEA